MMAVSFGEHSVRRAFVCLLAASSGAALAASMPEPQITVIDSDSMVVYRVDLASRSPTVVRNLSDKKEVDSSLIAIHKAMSAHDSQAAAEAEKLRRQLSVPANRVIRSPDGKSALAYFKDETKSTSERIWLVDAETGSTIGEVPVDGSIMYVRWTPNSDRAVIIERKFLRNSLSPLNLLSALLGHGVGIYRYSMLEIGRTLPALHHRTEVVTGTFHSVGFAWRN